MFRRKPDQPNVPLKVLGNVSSTRFGLGGPNRKNHIQIPLNASIHVTELPLRRVPELKYLRQTLVEVKQRNGGEVVIHCVNRQPDKWVGSDFVRKLSDAAAGSVAALPPAE